MAIFDLKNRAAFITGGNGGIGLGMARGLAEAGASIVIAGRNKTKAQAALSELRSLGAPAEFVELDVLNETSCRQAIQIAVERFGRLDILINDAAYNKAIAFQDLDGLTLEEWSKIIEINLTGPMLCIKAAAPFMQRHGQGRIVNISSVAGLGPHGSSIAYAVSKAGLIHLTRCMAVALAPNILVNCVAPGLLEGTRATVVPIGEDGQPLSVSGPGGEPVSATTLLDATS